MEKRIFQKAKLVAAVTLASTMTFGMTGCILGGDESITSAAIGNNGVTTTAPKGSIQGIVQDTNGNPIEGAQVYVGKRSVTTNAGGAYQIDDVAVTGLTVNQDGDYFGGAIRVVIVPPTGFLGATVEVYSTAVIDHGRSSQGTAEEAGIASTNRFIDGFTAVAGDAVLPAVGQSGATVTGVLRSEETGEPVANHSINMELLAINGSSHASTGSEISFAAISFPTTTAADGSFEISGVANDSNLRILVGGYIVEGMDANYVEGMPSVVTTNDEVENIHVGNVSVTAIPNEDEIAPYVVAIDEAVINATRAKLHDDVTNVLTVRFSETLDATAIDDNSVKVRDISANAYLNDITITAGADSKSIVLTKTAGNFLAGHEIDIYLLRVDFQDTSGNILEFNNIEGTSDIVKYDEVSVNGNTDFLNLMVELYQELNDEATIVTNEMQLLVDDTAQRELTLLDQASSVFSDVDMEAGDFDVIDQLNVSEAQSRIINLIKASEKAAKLDDDGIIFDSETGIPETTDLSVGVNTSLSYDQIVRVDVARIKFTASNATKYKYLVTDGTSDLEITPIIDTESSPGVEIVESLIVVEETGSDVVFTLSGVEPGNVITITSVDDFGNDGASKAITLRDNVAVTTGLQNAYSEQDLTSGSTTIGQIFGDGGELANPDAQSLIGSPLLSINSGMLADQFNTTHDAVLDSLYAANDVTEDDEVVFDVASKVYDSKAYLDWSQNSSRTVAISFTENLVWANGAVAPETTATSLSNWTVLNDVALNSEGDSISSDIIAFSAANIFDLANNAGQAQTVIDFTNVIEDLSGNVATSSANAKVVIFDALPPMVSKAEYFGGSLVIDFNESIKLTDGGKSSGVELVEVAILGGTPLILTKDAVDAFNAQDSADRKQLTIEFNEDAATEGGLPQIARTTLFPVASRYDSVAGGASGHAVLDFSLIQDNYGNTWAEDAAVITGPSFAVEDMIGDMSTLSVALTNFDSGEAEFIAKYKFTHPVDLDEVEGAAAAGLFTLTSGSAAVLASANTNIAISNDGKTVTVNIELTAALAPGDKFEFTNDVSSLWDSSTAASTTIEVN